MTVIQDQVDTDFGITSILVRSAFKNESCWIKCDTFTDSFMKLHSVSSTRANIEKYRNMEKYRNSEVGTIWNKSTFFLVELRGQTLLLSRFKVENL